MLRSLGGLARGSPSNFCTLEDGMTFNIIYGEPWIETAWQSILLWFSRTTNLPSDNRHNALCSNSLTLPSIAHQSFIKLTMPSV